MREPGEHIPAESDAPGRTPSLAASASTTHSGLLWTSEGGVRQGGGPPPKSGERKFSTGHRIQLPRNRLRKLTRKHRIHRRPKGT